MKKTILFIALTTAVFSVPSYYIGKADGAKEAAEPFCLSINMNDPEAKDMVKVEAVPYSSLTRLKDGAQITVPDPPSLVREKEKDNVVACPKEAGEK